MWTKTIKLLGLTGTQVKRMRYIIGVGLGAIVGLLFLLIQLSIIRKFGDLTELSTYIGLSVIIEGMCLDIIYELFKIGKSDQPPKPIIKKEMK